MDTVLQVLSDEPVPPRRLNATIPRDVETICLKCLEKEPGKRYGGAAELGEDLRRFLAGEPILGRPVSNTTRLWMWAQRHPTAAALVGSSLIAANAMIAAGFLVAYNGELKHANQLIEESRGKLKTSYESEAAARQQAEAAEKNALEQHAIAVKALGQARHAIDLANYFLEGMEVTLEGLKGPTVTTFPPADSPEFLEVMCDNQAVAAKVVYMVEESYEPMMRLAKLPGLTGAMARSWRGRLSLEFVKRGHEANGSEAMHRLQGHLSLILGRLLAVKVRCYEYNWACAMMKKDPRKFQKPRSNAWRLVPDEKIQYSEKAADAGMEAKALLRFVVEEHAGTPWATLAQRELSNPLGFRWVETYAGPVAREISVPDYRKKTKSIVMHADMTRCTKGVNQAASASQKVAVLSTLGAVLYRCGRLKEATRRLEEAVSVQGGLDEPGTWLFLAMAYHRVGRLDEARRWLDRFQHRRPISDPDRFWGEPDLRLLRSEAEAVILYDPIFPTDPFAR
jgi:hypothetical protein